MAHKVGDEFFLRRPLLGRPVTDQKVIFFSCVSFRFRPLLVVALGDTVLRACTPRTDTGLSERMREKPREIGTQSERDRESR